MLMLVMLIAGLAGQEWAGRDWVGPETAYSAAPSETYAPPTVRPYEPPSDFGRQVAEGDADASVRTRPIAAPVAVEAYRDTYERSRSPRELSYDQGVEQARVAQNVRMGPLDGVWRAQGEDGRPVANIVLSDRGPDVPVEGAVSLDGVQGSASGHSPRLTAMVQSVVRTGEAVEIDASADGRPVTFRLQQSASGWSGVMTGPAGRTTVTLIRSS